MLLSAIPTLSLADLLPAAGDITPVTGDGFAPLMAALLVPGDVAVAPPHPGEVLPIAGETVPVGLSDDRVFAVGGTPAVAAPTPIIPPRFTVPPVLAGGLAEASPLTPESPPNAPAYARIIIVAPTTAPLPQVIAGSKPQPARPIVRECLASDPSEPDDAKEDYADAPPSPKLLSPGTASAADVIVRAPVALAPSSSSLVEADAPAEPMPVGLSTTPAVGASRPDRARRHPSDRDIAEPPSKRLEVSASASEVPTAPVIAAGTADAPTKSEAAATHVEGLHDLAASSARPEAELPVSPSSAAPAAASARAAARAVGRAAQEPVKATTHRAAPVPEGSPVVLIAQPVHLRPATEATTAPDHPLQPISTPLMGAALPLSPQSAVTVGLPAQATGAVPINESAGTGSAPPSFALSEQAVLSTVTPAAATPESAASAGPVAPQPVPAASVPVAGNIPLALTEPPAFVRPAPGSDVPSLRGAVPTPSMPFRSAIAASPSEQTVPIVTLATPAIAATPRDPARSSALPKVMGIVPAAVRTQPSTAPSPIASSPVTVPLAVPAITTPVILPARQAFGAAIRRALAAEREPARPVVSIADPIAPFAATAPTLATTPLDTRIPGWPHAMVDHIEALRDLADAADTRIRLIPDALGAIDVGVRREGDTVHVHFTAQQADTRALLQDAQPRLVEAAEARGLKLGRTEVDAGTTRTGPDTSTTGQGQQHRATPPRPLSVRPAPARMIAVETDADTRIA